MALGIYISVPFCRTKCSYCNFASDVFSRAVFQRYVDRVCADLGTAEKTAAEMGAQFDHVGDSIYLGGGTPTVLDSALLERIFTSVRGQFDVMSGAEITVECAPGTLSSSMLAGLLECGVNRVSLGVQSFVDQEAAAVGRLHNRVTVLEDIARLRAAGITNINLDLIAGLPHQTAETWEFSLTEAIATGAPHVSVYMLEVDDDSRLGRELIAGGARYHAHFVPDEDAVADFYLLACERLAAAGIHQYEISNFAREGFESRHNLRYWTRQPYFGFGVDAHSMLPAMPQREIAKGTSSTRAGKGTLKEPGFSPSRHDSLRFATADSLDRFIQGAPLLRDVVTRQAALEESLFLGLRLTGGVNFRELAGLFGEQAIAGARATIGELTEIGLMEPCGDIVRLTPRGRLLSNEVFERFMAGEEVAR